jgi:hypothetical protein
LFLLEKIYFRWHQVIFLFGLKSVILRFDNQLDNIVELSSSLFRKSGKFSITGIAFLGANGHQENQINSVFKVKSSN